MRMATVFLLLSVQVVSGQAVPTVTPPDRIVIEPRKSTPVETNKAGTISVLKGVDPDRPSFIVIFPTAKAAGRNLVTTLPAPTPTGTAKIETVDGIPTITIIGTPSQKPTTPEATMLPQPIPVNTGAKPVPKPAELEKVEDGKILVETYDVAYCRGCKVGYLHTVVREYLRNDKRVIYGIKRLTLQVARFGQPVEQWSEEATTETEDGKVLSTSLRQGSGKVQMQELSGRVTEKGLEVNIRSGKVEAKDTIPWPEGVVGVGREATLLKDMKMKPGMTLEYPMYFGQFNGVMTFKLTAKGLEELSLDGAKPRKLLKVIQDMKAVGDFKMPPSTYYIDPTTHEPVAMETDMPLFGGVMTAKRTSREVALAKPTKYLDLGEVQSIVLPKASPGLHRAESAVYRLTVGGDGPLDKVFPTDERQKPSIVDEKTRTMELAVNANRTPSKPNVELKAPGKEYLADCLYIDWNNSLVKSHAAAAIKPLPQTASDWEKARAVETWVHRNMKQVEFSQAMASCGTVAQELSGDCTEHAMLATGMCRALGIPAKTTLGLVYFERKDGKAILAYHMWYEVWTDGGWLALDAIMGLGSVGPGHIKLIDAHWDGETGITPVLPVVNFVNSRPVVQIVKP